MEQQDLLLLKNRFSIIGNDPGLNRALETAVAIAPTDLTVLITGESGVGKENLPQIIHQFSRRKTGKYLAVNCGGLPPGTINAELFGHEKGAFTGAIGERKGYFEEANGGTLFLDEIGELPKDTQAMLLRVLQNGEYMKVGSSKVEKTDVRIVAATNVNLAYSVATGKFREDLYYRLCGINIKMPALRERNKDDIYLLFRKFSSDFAARYSLCKPELTHEAISLLTSYRWPGNIRQLKSVAETLTALRSQPATPSMQRITLGLDALAERMPNEKDSLLPAAPASTGAEGGMNDSDKQQFIKALMILKQEIEDLKDEVAALRKDGSAHKSSGAPRLLDFEHESTAPVYDASDTHGEPLETLTEQLSIKKVNDDLIEKCLAKHGGKVKLAAAELGISERTIYRKLAEKKAK